MSTKITKNICKDKKSKKILKFSDGTTVNIGGKLRIIEKLNKLYVVGRGSLISVKSYQEGQEFIYAIKDQIVIK